MTKLRTRLTTASVVRTQAAVYPRVMIGMFRNSCCKFCKPAIVRTMSAKQVNNKCDKDGQRIDQVPSGDQVGRVMLLLLYQLCWWTGEGNVVVDAPVIESVVHSFAFGCSSKTCATLCLGFDASPFQRLSFSHSAAASFTSITNNNIPLPLPAAIHRTSLSTGCDHRPVHRSVDCSLI